jgi:hypothetical protein
VSHAGYSNVLPRHLGRCNDVSTEFHIYNHLCVRSCNPVVGFLLKCASWRLIRKIYAAYENIIVGLTLAEARNCE